MSDYQPDGSPFNEEFLKLLDEPAFHMWMREDIRKIDQFECALLEEPNDSEGITAMQKYTDGMRQTVVADFKRLGIPGNSPLLRLAKEGNLDELLNVLENLPPSKTATNTAYMIPLIRAWQQQLGRPGNPPIR